MIRCRIFLALTLLSLAAIVAGLYFSVPRLYTAAAAVVAALSAIAGYLSTSKPLAAVQNGIYLLRAQDFSSKLRRVGQPDADKVVEMFNGMMEAMKTERLKAREQERFLSHLIAVSPTGIAVCDFKGNIVESNNAWTSLVDDNVLASVEALAPGESVTLRLSGSHIIRCSRLWFMDSGFRRTFYIAERITDEIVEAEKQLFNKTIRTISHEVNNTMGSVMSVLSTLAELPGTDAMTAAAVEGSCKSCDNLVRFVRSYADIVKLPAPEPVLTNVGEWLESLRPSLAAALPDNIELRIEPAPDFRLFANIDVMLMERVMVNIVKNSAESIASKPSGLITIRTDTQGIEIIDNGAGISEANARRLFTPFFSTKRPDRGLGLMLVADILRSHKATFTLTSDPASRLTTFRITFARQNMQF